VEVSDGSGYVLHGFPLLRFAEWYAQNIWRTVFIYVVVYTALIITQEITKATGVYCSTSSKPRFAKVWVGLLSPVMEWPNRVGRSKRLNSPRPSGLFSQ
jgi:hypothetical protein